jgi:hypothetical protein
LGKHNIIGKGYAVADIFLGDPIGNKGKGNKQNIGKDQHKEDYPLIIKAPGPQALKDFPHTVSLK